MNVNLYIYLIYLYLAKIMSDSYMKNKKKKNNDIDEYIKQDIKLSNFLKEGMSAIESFMNKKCRRYSRKLILEKELRMMKFQQKVEQKALNKKLNLKNDEEDASMISLDEGYDNDINDDVEENGGKKNE